MAVNGFKTEIVLFNYNSKDPFKIALNSDICKVKTSTKSLGTIIDNKINFKEHAELSVAKAQRNWAAITSKCTEMVSISHDPSLSLSNNYCAAIPVWCTALVPQNTHQLRCLQNNVMRKVFKHGPTPSIVACEALTGVPPIDFYCGSIAVKLAIKIRQNDDLVRDTHLKSISKSRSRANSLESSLKRYSRIMNKETILDCTNDQIAGFITDQWRRRWKNGKEGLTIPFSRTSVQVYQHLTILSTKRTNRSCVCRERTCMYWNGLYTMHLEMGRPPRYSEKQ